jgi:hypothetical protein
MSGSGIEFVSGIAEAAERRRLDRKALRCNAWLLRGAGQPVSVRTLDLNAGGIGLVADFNPRNGETCKVLLAAPSDPRGGPAIELDAIVAHSILNSREGAFVVGLRFTPVPADRLAALMPYLR